MVCVNRDGKDETIVAEVPPELKRLVDADERYNYEVVNAALWREFGGSRDAAVDRRIEYFEQQLSVIDNAIEDLKDDRQDILEKLEPLRRAKDDRQTHVRNVLDEAEERLQPQMLHSDNIAVKELAKDADLSPETFLKRYRERTDGD